MRLDGMAARLRLRTLTGTQPAAGAITGLLLDQAGSGGLIALHQVPDLALGVAEACKRAQRLRIVEHQGRAFDVPCLLVVGLAACRFGAVEADALVRAVTERLGARPPAATQGIALRGR